MEYVNGYILPPDQTSEQGGAARVAADSGARQSATEPHPANDALLARALEVPLSLFSITNPYFAQTIFFTAKARGKWAWLWPVFDRGHEAHLEFDPCLHALTA